MLEDLEPSASLKREPLGLALSGGGFRASFFHIGVLAKMAELGLLKRVEVISTVSGGSIIGALYYLHLKKLLETKTDSQIIDSDYLEIVEKITVDFLKAVQSNIIMTAYRDPLKTIKMASKSYSSSLRLAELYEKLFYKGVLNPNKTQPIKMSDLKIIPKGEDLDFYPLKHNTKRINKVPLLLINAALLNTGRVWYFEATHMGEVPHEDYIAQEVDKNLRLIRPISYSPLIKNHSDFLLSHAVAASAALPAVFAPIRISGLYSNMDLQLVDGGVDDNQGVKALLNFDCTDFIISDASRPLEFEPYPDIRNDGLLLRVRSILGNRLREEQLSRMLEGERKNRTAFIHLQKNFPIAKQHYLTNKQELTETNIKNSLSNLDFIIPKGDLSVAPEVQQALSRLRTHLDSFTDVEAYSLMFYGYQVSDQTFFETPSLKQFIKKSDQKINWNFLNIAPWAKTPTPSYIKQLKVGNERFLKVFRLKPNVRTISLIVLLFIFILIVWGIFSLLSTIWSIPEIYNLFAVPLNEAVDRTIPIITVIFILRIIFAGRYLAFKQRVFSFWARAAFPALCFPLVWLHLYFYDLLFLDLGKIDKLEKHFFQQEQIKNKSQEGDPSKNTDQEIDRDQFLDQQDRGDRG
jgi:NTE family protein